MEKIEAELGLKIGAFQSGLATARNQASKFAADVKGTISGQLAGMLGAGAIFAGFAKAIDTADQLQDLSDRLGVASDTLQKFGNEAAKNGSSLEGMGNGIKFLMKNSSNALAGNEELRGSFAKLGISLEDLQNLSTEDLLVKVGAGLNNASSDGERMALAMQVLGKAGGELIPTLRGVADGSIQLSEGMSKETIANLGRLKDTFQDIQVSMTNFFASLIMGVQKSAIGIAYLWDVMSKGRDEADRLAKIRIDNMNVVGPSRGGGGVQDIEEVKSKRELIDLEKELAEIQNEANRKRLDAEQQIVQLANERFALNQKLSETKDVDEAEKIKREILSKSKEIESLKDQMTKEKERADEEATRKQEKADKDAAKKSEDEKEKADRLRQKQEEFDLETQILEARAAGDKEAEASLQRQLELMKGMDEGLSEDQINRRVDAEEAAKKEKDDSSKYRVAVTASSLARIGGGGNFVAGSDPVLKENQEHTKLLKEIAQVLKEQNEQTSVVATFG